MKLKLFLAWIPLFLFGACAFKSEENKPASNQVATATELKVDPNNDTDGDGVKDGEEISRGSNPFVADLPELKVKFLQNYKIEVFYHPKNGDSVKDQKSFVIDTNIKDTNPDFKFRVGDVFARENALKKAASFARYPNNTKGVIEDRDFSWVKYPDIDPSFLTPYILWTLS